uniref:DNA ligase ATP-dependent N-terminal domain-containing protein n=1 Tax=Glycine max TaxID=3847 RepID=K7K7A2_SOYBN
MDFETLDSTQLFLIALKTLQPQPSLQTHHPPHPFPCQRLQPRRPPLPLLRPLPFLVPRRHLLHLSPRRPRRPPPTLLAALHRRRPSHANHCPSAVQSLFIPRATDDTTALRYAHNSDFRFSNCMVSEPALAPFVGVDAMFLDTTYCNPNVECKCENNSNDKVLFLVATYVIGKEKILPKLARRFKRKIHVDARKMEVLRVLGYGENGEFIKDEKESNIHVVGWNVLGETWPYFRPNFVRMKEVVSFVPTQWTYEVKRNKFAVKSKDSFQINLVPYICDVEKSDSKHADKMRKYFTWLVDETANKQDFLRGFHCVPCEKGEVGFKAEKVVSDAREPGQDMDKEVNALEKTEGDIGIGPDVAVGLSSFMEETWSNVVEAVSNFYKRETEFHEQVISCQNPVSTPKGCSLNTDSLAKPCLNTNNTGKNINIFSSQDSKLNNLRHTVPSPISPAKRKRSSDSKQKKKKPKVKARSEPSGSKQATITRFFSKLIPEMPGGAHSYNSEPKLDQSSKVEDLLPTDDRQLYKDEIDQFMQIINGNESLKKYAITIIEKTKGDINKALDIYYGNSEYLGENKISVESKIDRPVKVLKDNVDATHLSLPPEKYNPKEHATCWRDGQPAPYLHIARTLNLLEGEKGKIKATSLLCNMFRSLSALSLADVLPAVYLCNTKIGADHENKELNIGGSLVTAIFGTNKGDVAQECRQTHKSVVKHRLLATPTPLLIKDVFSALQKISVGSGSTSRKKGIIVHLMHSYCEKEMKFLVRTLRVISSFSEKIVSSTLSARMELSQISLTRAKHAFADKKPFLSLNCRE